MAVTKNNKNKNGRADTRMVSPINRTIKRVPRPRVSFDGTTLSGFGLATRDITAANVASHMFLVDCSNSFSSVGGVKILEGIGRSLAALTGFYQEYRYTNVKLQWIPHVAPGVADGGASICIGYIDNPENIFQRYTSAAVTDIVSVKGLRNFKSFNAWQGFTYNVPLTRRLPWFNVNSTLTTSDAIDAVRAIQGACLVGYESLSAVIDLGVWHYTYDVEVRGLTTTFST
jgi:hypothetical protein